ncbi:hypothetical protein ACTA71_008881 [Dictyostelium dimigraforme]
MALLLNQWIVSNLTTHKKVKSNQLPTSKGISFLETKYQLLSCLNITYFLTLWQLIQQFSYGFNEGIFQYSLCSSTIFHSIKVIVIGTIANVSNIDRIRL